MLDPRAEDGVALVLALAVLVFFSATTATAIYMYSSSQTTASNSSAAQNASALAESGINDALAVLHGQLDSIGAIVGTDPRTSTLLASTTVDYPTLSGSVTYSGTIDAGYVWTIISTGQVTDRGHIVSRTLTQTANVVGITNGTTGGFWSRFYQDSTSSCLTIDAQAFVTNVGTRGNLCLTGGATITGASTNIDVGGNVYLAPTIPPQAKAPSDETTAWTSASRVETDNNSYATNSVSPATTGANLDSSNFGFSIPTNATVNGISVLVQKKAAVCCDDVQTISVTGSPSSGSFTLKGNAPGPTSTSGSIARNAPASGGTSVTSALNSIYGSGNVSCSGGPLPAAVICVLQGTYANTAMGLMSVASSTLNNGAHATIAHTKTGGQSDGLQDATVQLLKNGSATGSNKASTAYWGTSESAVTYGSSSDLWGTTWTPADVNNGNFGLRFAAKNLTTTQSVTASIDYVQVTVTFTQPTSYIGTSTTPINDVNVGGTCTLGANSAHSPCSSVDNVYGTNVTSTAATDNPALVMPVVDYNYWWANAKPGPKHPCTYSTGTVPPFDGPDSHGHNSTTGPDDSLGQNDNGDMAMGGQSYTCQVWSQPDTVHHTACCGTLLGELSWNSGTHILTINGTVFVDGNFRFDTDGEVVNYHGRGTMMSSGDDEIDAVVCAGGTATTIAASCWNNMSSWDPTTNLLVLMSEQDNEYDQGGSNCTGSAPNCYAGHWASGFQGVLYSTADCLIHQNFRDSGPVICNTITLPSETTGNPIYYTYPSIGNLTDGQHFADTATATYFEIDTGQQTG